MGGKIHVKSEELKYVQIHDLDDSYNNSRVHYSYDLRLQIKQRGNLLATLSKEDLGTNEIKMMRCNKHIINELKFFF